MSTPHERKKLYVQFLEGSLRELNEEVAGLRGRVDKLHLLLERQNKRILSLMESARVYGNSPPEEELKN